MCAGLKSDGSYWLCGDYHRLSDVTILDHYPVLHVQDFSSRLAGKTIFSKVHLVRGYHQVPVHQADIPKTAMVTPFGSFEFIQMLFGLKIATQIFQRLIDSWISFCRKYIQGRAFSVCLCSLFECLSTHWLIINLAKCQFSLLSIDFLGDKIISEGLHLLVRRDDLKVLAKPAMLAHRLPDVPIALTTDASDFVVGAVQELLVHFCFFFEGQIFTDFFDHKSLTFATSKVSEPWSACQQRHLAYISEFTTYIQHKST